MLTTEKEAVEKACVDKGQGVCLASRCMAWRWHGWLNQEGEYYVSRAHGMDLERLNPWAGPDDQMVGYCGKAGAPTRGEL